MSTLTVPTITEEQVEQFQNRGFFTMENALDPDSLEHLRNYAATAMDRIHRKMDEKGVDVLGITHRNKRYFIPGTFREHPDSYAFFFGPLLEEICRKTLGGTAKFFLDQYVIKSAEKGAHFSWHQDSGYIAYDHEPYITCWVTLDDVNEENGTVYLLPYDEIGIRTRVRHIKDPVWNDNVGYFGSNPGTPVILPAGSVAVFSSVCFHRSGPNTTNAPRRVMVCQYTKDGIMNPWTGEQRGSAVPFLEDGERVDPGFDKLSEYGGEGYQRGAGQAKS